MNTLRIECPYCGDRNGEPRFHTHGTGGKSGPWHRLAHCADADLPSRICERQRDGSLRYELVKVSGRA
jgi:sarcosine oxidase delta subunit